jgi:hypothetical protein
MKLNTSGLPVYLRSTYADIINFIIDVENSIDGNTTLWQVLDSEHECQDDVYTEPTYESEFYRLSNNGVIGVRAKSRNFAVVLLYFLKLAIDDQFVDIIIQADQPIAFNIERIIMYNGNNIRANTHKLDRLRGYTTNLAQTLIFNVSDFISD